MVNEGGDTIEGEKPKISRFWVSISEEAHSFSRLDITVTKDTKMNQSIFCCICNNRPAVTNIFTAVINTNTGQTFASLLSDILDKTLPKDGLHSSVICKKCHKICTEYESIKLRSQVIKSEFVDQFKTTLKKHNQNYDSFSNCDSEKSPVKSGSNTPKKFGKVVLPASKLQPLPSDYVLNMSKLTGNQKFKMVTKTVPSGFETTSNSKPISTVSVKTEPVTSSQNSDTNILDNCITTILNTKTTNSVLSFNVNSLPQEFLNSNDVLTKVDGGAKIEDDAKEVDTEALDNEDDQSMEIDSDCTLVRVTSVNDLLMDRSEHSDKEDSVKSQYIDVVPLGEEERERILGKLVLDQEGNEDDDDPETIVMTEEDGDILRVVSGQKLVYENGEISIVADDDEDISQDCDYNDADAHDSNDESQIELQVSGDEETANAIIAAAQERGGAFIKVESGEMFRVKSVQSSTSESNTETQLVSQEGGVFKCLVCLNGDPLTSQTYDGETVMQHLKTEHGARVYICRVCKKVYRKRLDLYKHMNDHNPGYKTATTTDKGKCHDCNICNKKYNSRTLLEEHMNTHSGSRPYTCSVCNKSFSSKYTLQAHLKTHGDRPRPYKCTKCPKSFLTLQNLTQHVKTHSGIKDFVCNVCGKAFGSQHNLEVHGIVHSGNKPFVCGVCGKGFARRAEVKDHMRIHTGERPFACDICGATFTQRSNLHSHKRATHMNDKRYHCTQCPKRFKRRRLLDYHIQGSHTGERPLQCETCHATFVYPEHYKKHIRIHSGEKPYVCEVCGKSFNSRDNRNTHRFTHSDKKPYECLVCGAGFMRKQLLYAHMNMAGHIAESIVVNQPRVQKVQTVNVDAIKKPDKLQTIFEDSQDLEEATVEKSPEKATLSLTQDSEDGTFLSIQSLDDSRNDEAASLILQSITAEQLGDQTEMVATDEKGAMVRLVQIQLEDGNSGWMAIPQ